ncbi:MAG: BON domain-containing protein [Deltaproteobacteria bacterium]|nr:BON domain-containing protein [Deltaproteobacteria bacterium]
MNRKNQASPRPVHRIARAPGDIKGVDVATRGGGTNWRGPGEELHPENERYGDQSAVRADHWPERERWSPQDNFPSGGFDDAFGWDMRVGGHYSTRDPEPDQAWHLERADVFFGEEFGAGPFKEMRSVVPRHPSGPKGYVRSDARITEDICERIFTLDDLDATEVTVSVLHGEVKLTGTVADRVSKFRLEQLCDAVPGVKEIHNALRVQHHATSLVGSH